jgi:hypothetical protein
MAEAKRRAMEMERHELKVIVKRISTIMDRTTLLKKSIKIPDPIDSCGHRQNKIMISMLSGWRT